MVIIGITGAIGHGKTTLAKAFEDCTTSSIHLEIGELVCEVANRMNKHLSVLPTKHDYDSINNWLKFLPDILKSTVHKKCDFNDLALKGAPNGSDISVHSNLFDYLDKLQNNPSLAKAEINNDNKEEYRDFLQWLGGYLIIKIDPGIWSTEIVRRLNDSDKMLGVVGGIRYPFDAQTIRNAGGVIVQIQRNGSKEQDLADATESQRRLIKPDTVVDNNSSIEDLKLAAKIILADIMSGNLVKTYDYKRINLNK